MSLSGRGSLRAATVAIAVFGFLVGGTLVSSSASAVPATPTASACNAFELIGARGSGEDEGSSAIYSGTDLGLGAPVSDLFGRFQAEAKAAGVTVGEYAVHYPAHGVGWDKNQGVWTNLGDVETGLTAALNVGAVYDLSVAIGARDLENVISGSRKVDGVCSTTRFILSGYSQGAQVVGKAIQGLDSTNRDLVNSRVVATVLFGDPLFNATDSSADLSSFQTDHYGALGHRDAWSTAISSPVYSYCHAFDPICNGDKKTFCLAGFVNIDPDCTLAPGLPGIRYVRDLLNVAAAELVTGNAFTEHANYDKAGDTSDAALRLASLLKFPGQSVTTAPTDIAFVIDSTGSMSDEISDVQNNVIQLAQVISSRSSSFRFALVDYKDDPDDDSAYQSQVDVPFTADTTTFTAGVSKIDVTGGGDTPESMYSGIMTALELPWRTGVRKTVIVIGDAPGKDPEPVTGYTLKSVTDKAFAIDPGQVYSVPVNGDPDATAFMSAVSGATGGTVTAAPTTADFLASLKSAVLQAGSAPVAAVSGAASVVAGLPTGLGAAGTKSNPGDPIVGYDWNFGKGTPSGEYDLTTTTPLVSTTFATAGTYSVAVRVRVKSGLSGLATKRIVVAPAPTGKPAKPARLRAKTSSHAVTLTWRAGSGVKPEYYIVKDGKGRVVAALSAKNPPTTVTWTDKGLHNGTATSFTVIAANSAGYSSPAGPARAIPHGPKPPLTVGDLILRLLPWIIGVVVLLAGLAVLTILLIRQYRRR